MSEQEQELIVQVQTKAEQDTRDLLEVASALYSTLRRVYDRVSHHGLERDFDVESVLSDAGAILASMGVVSEIDPTEPMPVSLDEPDLNGLAETVFSGEWDEF